MTSRLSFGVLVVLLIALSVLLAGVAANAALARADVGTLDTELASLINADYSADGSEGDIGRLGEGIIEAARADDERLLATATDIEIVPAVRKLLAPNGGGGGFPPRDGVPPAGSDTPTPTPNPGTTPSPGATPGSGPTPKPDATATPTPAPTATAKPDPKTPPPPPPTPTPIPSALSGKYYLHNDPTPPTGHTTSHPLLSFDTQAPTATTLFNYDTNRDSTAGLLIRKGGSGANETDPTMHQSWQGLAPNAPRVINSNVVFHVYSAMKEFATGKTGSARAYLRDCAGSSCTLIAQDTRTETNWQGGGNTWAQKNFNFLVSGYTLAAGHRLEVKLIVDAASDDDLMFAYDTTTYNAHLNF